MRTLSAQLEIWELMIMNSLVRSFDRIVSRTLPGRAVLGVAPLILIMSGGLPPAAAQDIDLNLPDFDLTLPDEPEFSIPQSCPAPGVELTFNNVPQCCRWEPATTAGDPPYVSCNGWPTLLPSDLEAQLGNPPGGQIDLGSCSALVGRNSIFQLPDCGDDIEASNALRTLQAESVFDVIAAHELPGGDADKVLAHARDNVRGYMFARLMDVVADTERSASEQAIVDYYAERIKAERVRTAQLALEEYDIWAASPATYDPPGEFVGANYSGSCTPLETLFGCPDPPSFEDFQGYAAAEVDADLLSRNGLQVMSNTARAYAFYIGLAAAVALGAITVPLLTGLGVGTTLLAAIFPFMVKAKYVGAGAFALASFTGGAIAVGGAVAVVLVALVIGILRSIEVAEDAALEQKLIETVEQAEAASPPDLQVLTSSPEGVQEFFKTFIKTTLPEFPSDAPVPAPAADDPRFRVTDESGANPLVVEVLEYTDGDARWRARLSGGWFVDMIDVTFPDRGDVNLQVLTLGINYLDWDRELWTAWRVGNQFLHTRADLAQDPEGGAGEDDSFVSDEIRFLAHDNARRIATIFTDTTPPSIGPEIAGTEGANGWYVSDVQVTWLVTDEESEITESTCDPVPITTDGTHLLGCTASSAGGSETGSVTIKRDTVSPQIAGGLTPPANDFGWNNGDVEVAFECSDATSGIEICTEPSTLTTEGQDQPVEGRATDQAGHTASATVLVSIDRTPPNVAGSASPPPNEAGWNNTPVSVEFTCDDELSGLIEICLGQTLTGDGADQSLTGRARDKAGNEASATVGGINIDRTPPAIVLSSPASGAAFVQNQVVLAEWTASDALSGLAEASGTAADGAPVPTSAAGAATFVVEARDQADNRNAVEHGYTMLSAAEAASTLIATVNASGLPGGTVQSLVAQLEAARSSLQRGNRKAAEGSLRAFINRVQSQRGEQIPPDQADPLIAYAELILGAMTVQSS